jgi:hypothetical protein
MGKIVEIVSSILSADFAVLQGQKGQEGRTGLCYAIAFRTRISAYKTAEERILQVMDEAAIDKAVDIFRVVWRLFRF